MLPTQIKPNMKHFLSLFFISASLCSQTLHHAALAAQGSTKILSSGHYISQSIGQNSVIGYSSTRNSENLQGFQQHAQNLYRLQHNHSGTVTVFPNPFDKEVRFQFSENNVENTHIYVYDLLGRVVFKKTVTPENNTIILQLPFLATAVYNVQLKGPNYFYTTKIIKR